MLRCVNCVQLLREWLSHVAGVRTSFRCVFFSRIRIMLYRQLCNMRVCVVCLWTLETIYVSHMRYFILFVCLLLCTFTWVGSDVAQSVNTHRIPKERTSGDEISSGNRCTRAMVTSQLYRARSHQRNMCNIRALSIWWQWAEYMMMMTMMMMAMMV